MTLEEWEKGAVRVIASKVNSLEGMASDLAKNLLPDSHVHIVVL